MGRFFCIVKSKPPLFGVCQMGEVARHSRVGGGNAPSVMLSHDSSPIPYGTGEPFIPYAVIYISPMNQMTARAVRVTRVSMVTP